MIDRWIRVLPAEELPEGGMIEVECEGRLLCLYNLDGEIFATAAHCTHGNASLADGCIVGAEVECPFHQGLFDIRTGRATGAPCTEDLQAYPARIGSGGIEVALDLSEQASNSNSRSSCDSQVSAA